MNTFYRHFWQSKYCLSTSRKLVTNFEKYIPNTIIDYSNFIKELESAAKNYAEIISPNIESWKQPEYLSVYMTLMAFNVFRTTQVRMFLLALFDAKSVDIISHKNYKKILNYLEHYHFVFTAVCSSRPSGLERRYSSYARQIRNCSSKEESSECINNLIRDFDESMPAYEIFESCLQNIIYTSSEERNKKLVQYILKKLEVYYSSNELKPNSFTIEHILPESTKGDCVGMLGNLLPLGEKLNSELQNEKFEDKMKRYPESQYATVRNFVEKYSDSNVWDDNEIVERTKQIARILYDNIIEG